MGIQMALGPNVKVCDNMCIFGYERFMSTYATKDKMPNPQRMIEVLGEWLSNFEEIRTQDLQTMEKLQNTTVPHKEVLEIIGDLTSMRVIKENAKLFPKPSTPPLHGGQVSKFTLAYLKEHASNDGLKVFSAWDLYNFATEMYKPGETDMPIILSNNHTMSQYLMNRYKLN